MQKEAVYIQRIKDLQEELNQKDLTIQQLLDKIQFFEENQTTVINKQNYIESVKEANALISRIRAELREIQTFKEELAQKVYTTFRF